MKDTYLYREYGNIYINLTNRCSNDCEFCIRNERDGIEEQHLWLSREPEAADVINLCPQNLADFSEVVFCGFGEPTYRLDVLLEVAAFFKSKGKRTRLNTNGHSDLINKKPTAPLLKGLVDTVSISLNASTEESYDRICRPILGAAFSAMLTFAKGCKEAGIDTVLSVVDVIGRKELARCKSLCDELGIGLRIRSLIT